MGRWLNAGMLVLLVGIAGGCEAPAEDGIAETARAGALTAGTAWSHSPPGGKAVADVPQFVAVTFDDNFSLADPTSAGGADYIVRDYKTLKNPAGTGNAANFDGAPVQTTFYNTSVYISTDGDPIHKNRTSWQNAFDAGHEMADHTINHYNGGGAGDPTGDDCCKPRQWTVPQWVEEIKGCKDQMTDPTNGIVGLAAKDVIGFRTPFLSYNDALFTALTDQGFTYDSTIPNCFADGEDGTNCSWPYTLDSGSPDADTLTSKFQLDAVKEHPGLWELPIATLIVPPDEQAAAYAFTAGLRGRIAALGTLPYPSLYEPATGKLAGLDYTILIDCNLLPEEMLAILKYNLDLHLAGNRSPFIFIAHSFLYAYTASNEGKPMDMQDNYTTPSAAVRDARWKAIMDFLTYAVSKPAVRVRPVRDITAWMTAAATGPAPGPMPMSSGGSGGCTVGSGRPAAGGTVAFLLALAALGAARRRRRAP